MFGACFNHVWPSSTFRLARFLNYSRCNQFGWWDIFLEFLFWHSDRFILGPCWGHVCLKLDLRLARALKFSVLGHSGLQDKTMEYWILIIMQEPCLTLFGLALLKGYVELKNFEEWINWVQMIHPWNFILWDHAKAMFGPRWSNGWHSFTSILSQAVTILRFCWFGLRNMSIKFPIMEP